MELKSIMVITYFDKALELLESCILWLNKQISTWFVKLHPAKIVCLFCLVLSVVNVTFGQDFYRRHFIIAYDASTSLNNCNGIYDVLASLFKNERVDATGDQNLIKNDKLFFDTNKDEISFFDFNFSDYDIASLKDVKKKELAMKMQELFFKTQTNWSRYKMVRQPPHFVVDYIFHRLIYARSPSNLTIPNLVYPLVLNRLDQTKYAEEYILIVLTQTTPELFNGVDQYVLKTKIANDSLAINYIAGQINDINASFTKKNYFSYTAGIFGYFITPKNVLPASAATSVSIEPDIKFTQADYDGSVFTTSPIKLKFPDNEALKPVEAELTISMQNSDGYSEIFKEKVVSPELDNKEMKFDVSSSTYSLPKQKIDLEQLNTNRDKTLRIILRIKAQAKTLENNSLNLLFYAETTVPIQNISYVGFYEHLSYYIVPIILILLVLFILVGYGQPQKMKFIVNGYLDSFEIVDYNTIGKLHTPYLFWNGQIDSLVVDGEISFSNLKYFFNWKPAVYISINNSSVPNGFDVFLKPKTNSSREFQQGNNMPIQISDDNKCSFIIYLRQNDNNIRINEPKLIKINISAFIRETRMFFISSEIREDINYSFHIGKDLGDVWVALDPGTTGSCIAVGNHANNIVIAEDIGKSKVIDSKLIFDISKNLIQLNGEVPEDIYLFGNKARIKFGYPDVASFQSIKKLLGFNNVKEIQFKNNNTLKLTGKDLSGLIVKGLYDELKNFVSRVNNPVYFENGKFVPKRAVIAIPNNFTSSKIQDIIDCTRQLKKFEEIRYVFEPEAVLFYYLSNYGRFNKGKSSFKDENILIFDMGGATINVSLFNATKTEKNNDTIHVIDVLGRIGYGIGGDTIDYCIIKFINSFKNEYDVFKNLEFRKDNKEQLVKASREIKELIGKAFYLNSDCLISAELLGLFLEGALNKSIKIEKAGNFYQSFLKDSNGKFGFFSHEIFKDLIYDNVKDAVNNVIELTGNCKIDKLIFSGRSTFFPYIKEVVETELIAKNINAKKVVFDIEESKTAVALGACWYGINKNSIELNNRITNASFGIMKTLSHDVKNVAFMEIVKMGHPFDNYKSGIDTIEGKIELHDNFSFDNANVNFFQIMGKDASEILSKNQKHKFSRIANIRIPQPLIEIQMVVSENDRIECKVKLKNGISIPVPGTVSDQEISAANEEHYTYINLD